MITITNQYNTALIYADRIDSGAEGLLRALCASPASQDCRIRVMPDVHAGRGCAVGTTMTIRDRVIPGLVGVDIGCGMGVARISGKRLELQKLDKLVHEKIPSGRKVRTVSHRFAERVDLDALRCVRHVQQEKAQCSIGTLGGGNHFIEVDKGVDGTYWLIVHSGSRHLGLEVASWYQNATFQQCPDGTPYELVWVSGALKDDYLHDMKIVQEFAAVNRQAIMDELIKGMKLDIIETFSSIHNYIDLDAMILRKGAVSAQAGEKLLIPMNMRDSCLLCIGKGNEEWNFSAPHGAGRRMSRAETRQSFTLSQYKKEMKGVYTTSVSRETLDESPMAYKPMEDILSQIGPTVEVLERLTPVYNFKAGRTERMIYQISSGQGPAECELGVAKFLEYLTKNYHVTVQETSAGYHEGTYRSVRLSTNEDLSCYEGSVQWICRSPYRPNHKRKNWFLDFSSCGTARTSDFDAKQVIFETFRSGGKGGQNVNKVESGIRAIYLPSGQAVECTEERSQNANKQKAVARLRMLIDQQNQQEKAAVKNSDWRCHTSLKRGNAGAVFVGAAFKRK